MLPCNCTNMAQMSPENICRICQRGTPQKGLIEPCNCNGSIGGVHKSCLERWLTISRRSKCELCGVSIPCLQVTPTFRDYARTFPRPLVGDLLLFTFLTPIATLLTLLCFQGAMMQIKWQNLTESSFLLAFGAILLTFYFGWVYWSIKNNYQIFLDWQSSNTNLRIDWPRRRGRKREKTINSIEKAVLDSDDPEQSLSLL
ncbi:E3 ubiquitin-protein ligase MARCH2 [Tetranychus urticae]|uniref:RING-CH-type domain-containing protein n=1 Tax=Tetranychus urticae TaxID=32264 RepID=T1KZU3_TETUR|nr:E3 ubiquitin-protein ligase MARCH2 [Tetranychus urticae]